MSPYPAVAGHLKLVPTESALPRDTPPPDESPLRGCWSLTGVREDVESNWRATAWLGLLEGLWPHEVVEVIHNFGPRYSMEVRLRQTMAAHGASETLAIMPSVLATAFPSLVFAAASLQDRVDALPVRLMMQPGRVAACRSGRHESAELPFPGKLPGWRLTRPFDEPLFDGPATLEIGFQATGLDKDSRDLLDRSQLALRMGALHVHPKHECRWPHGFDEALAERAAAHWRALLTHPRQGYRVEILMRSASPTSQFAIRRVQKDLFGHAFEVRTINLDGATPGERNWPVPFEAGLPGFVPSEGCLLRAGIAGVASEPAHVPVGAGSSIGMTTGGQAVVLPDALRGSHTLVLGASGVGKSTLLHQLRLQDIQRGAGLCSIDAHLPDFETALASIPAERQGDVVVLDLADPEFAVSINPLPPPDAALSLKRMVARQIAEIIESHFETATTSGPMTRSVVGLVIDLTMWHPEGGTMADCLRILDDDDYRDWLLSKCRDSRLTGAWQGFRRTTGDSGYENWKPYARSRFVDFTASPVMLATLGMPETVNLASAMADNKIVLVHLGKGSVLTDTQCQLMGSLLLTRLRTAAMGRSSAARMGLFHVVIDEFHTFAAPDTPNLFRELRKFGVALTVATQSIDSLRHSQGGDIANTVLANTAAKVLMRLSPRDAVAIDEYTAPEFPARRVARLPNCEAILSLPAAGIAPLRFRSLKPVLPPGLADPTELRRSSAERYGRRWSAIREDLAKRHGMTPDEFPA